MRTERLVQRIAEFDLPTPYGVFRGVAYETTLDKIRNGVVAPVPALMNSVTVDKSLVTVRLFLSSTATWGGELSAPPATPRNEASTRNWRRMILGVAPSALISSRCVGVFER